jgi:heat shock protein HtpX
MPITCIDIERQKSWRIIVFLSILIALYFIISFSIAASFYQMFSAGLFSLNIFSPGPPVLIAVSIFSMLVAIIHFCLSSFNAVDHIRRGLSAIEPDREDEIHKQFRNIVDEIQIASGVKIKIQCCVIPTLSVNALSAVDLRGNAMIAITEGLLSRISRAQLEAVVAHEAYHILSGDCLETTVAASLFGIPSSAIEKARAASEGRIFFAPAFLFAWFLVKVSYLLNMFISREREYRADAGAVRMTRNPMALAEVLYLISRRWKGAGRLGAGIEMLCIMNTSDSMLDESDGWLADLMSTHPPVKKRIRILLGMAHAGLYELRKQTRGDNCNKLSEKSQAVFYALDTGYQWQGPFALTELAALPWLSADTWISKNGSSIEKISRIPVADAVYREWSAHDEKTVSDYQCPSCRHPLISKTYERTKIYQCRFCGGSLVEDVKLPRIIARKDVKYSERIFALSNMTLSENQLSMLSRNKAKGAANMNLLCCPKCRSKMNRTFYSMAYLVEIDRCSYCGMSWFEKDELEILQCMIDNRMASGSFCSPSKSIAITSDHS